MIIGITGKSGSGKSTFAKLCFKNRKRIRFWRLGFGLGGRMG